MFYRDCELNPELACYLLTVMRKAFQNFAWGQSSFNENILKNMEIRLPVDSNDNIDYTYITAFIKAQEKLSIKSVIDWKDKIISTSKKYIYKIGLPQIKVQSLHLLGVKKNDLFSIIFL